MSNKKPKTTSPVTNQKNSVVVPSLEFPEDPVDFLGHVLDHHPRNTVTLRKVMSLGKVIYSKEPTMTAAVANTKPTTLIFGLPFMEEHMKTIEDCVYLLHHELTHLVLDHFAPDVIQQFQDKKLGQKAMHVIVDCQVNATCHHTLDNPKYFEFIKRYYKQDEMPYCFFREDGIPPTDDLKKLHKKLYSVDGITNEELIDGLMPWFEQQQDQLDQIIKNLLGNHSEIMKDRTGSNGSSGQAGDIAQEIGKSMSDYLNDKRNQAKEAEDAEGSGQGGEDKQKDGKASGSQASAEAGEKAEQQGEDPGGTQAGAGGPPRIRYIDVLLDKISYARNIRISASMCEVVSPSSRIFKAIDAYCPRKPQRSVIPNFYDRRTVALYSQGKMPVFHKYPERGANVVVPCYLDVSGSQDHVLPHLLPVVSRLKDKIGHLVFCFSTYIAETKISDLARGRINTSGGTDFNPVAAHIIKNRFKNAIILTDGQAWLNDEFKERLRMMNVNITVGWTTSRPQFNPLRELAKKEFYVFDKNSNY